MRLTRCDVADIAMQLCIVAVVAEIGLAFVAMGDWFPRAMLVTAVYCWATILIPEWLYRRAKRKGLGKQWLTLYIGEPFVEDEWQRPAYDSGYIPLKKPWN